MFSPWYALARRRRGDGAADPLDHPALNVALYGAPRRWALTERPRAAVRRDADRLAIGPSALEWDGACLTLRVEEVTAPLPSRLRGTVRLWPEADLDRRTFALDAAGRHRWTPLAAVSRVEVEFERPAGLRWSGRAYLDSNEGDAPLERDFVAWDWCRAPLPSGAGTAILYEGTRRDGSDFALALRARASGGVEEVEPPPPAALPPTRLWRMPRRTRAEGGAARATGTLEDTPFYSRSVLSTRLLGEDATAVHESLSLDRFRRPVVQAMLPFRVPRAFR